MQPQQPQQSQPQSHQPPSHSLNHTISFLPQSSLPHVNKNNLHSYSPYYYNHQKECYIVDEVWFEGLKEETRVQMREKFGSGSGGEGEGEGGGWRMEIGAVEYPHGVDKGFQYWEVYGWYNCQLYDFGRYINDIAEINKEQLHLVPFLDLAQRAQFHQLFFKKPPNISTLPRLNTQIQKILNLTSTTPSPKSYFIKLTQRSAKNEIKLFPARTLEDVYNNLLYSQDVRKEVSSSSGILLREWRDFSGAVQFRVFVYRGRLLGASPQFYNKKLQWKNVDFGKFVQLLQEAIKNVKFENSYVLDVMFMDNSRLWFLEFNPYGVYAASRSALFTHEELLKLEKQQQLPVIKLLQN